MVRSNFTPDEDVIIVETADLSYDGTIKRLEAAGYPSRTHAEVKGRRNYLRKKKLLVEEHGITPGALVMRQRTLEHRRELLLDELKQVEGELEVLNRQIGDFLRGDSQ